MRKHPKEMCRGLEDPPGDLKELSTIFIRERRVWVWPDHPKSDDANYGSYIRPLKSLDCGKARASKGDVLIYIPPSTS